MQQVKFPCPDCKGVPGHVHYPSIGFRDGICPTCCGIGMKYISQNYPSNMDQRLRIVKAYRDYMGDKKNV